MNKILFSIAICACVTFSADLTITVTDYKKENPQRHKIIILRGKKGTTYETTTNGQGIAYVKVANGDIYTFLCDGITGEFDCGFGNTMKVPDDAGSGNWNLYYDDNRFDLKGVNFATGKSELLSTSFKILESTVKGLQKYCNAGVEIEGHTDNVGGLEYNDKLSQARADAVRDYLVKKGIAENRVRAVGYGYSRPRAYNNTEKGKAENRRIEIKLIGQQGDPCVNAPN
jgi:outer membrane protein OmpA-like peptidoglycan-associated protein